MLFRSVKSVLIEKGGAPGGGFGAWAIGGGAMIGKTAIGWGNADDIVSVEAIHASLEAGINFFDTADIYGLGHSEELLGKTIGHKKEVIIATKVGNVSRNQQFTFDYSKEYILQACENSLRRLKRDTSYSPKFLPVSNSPSL